MIAPKYVRVAPTRAEERDAYELVTLRDANTCQRCRRNCGPIARDHRKNRGQGGWTAPSNLQCLGLGCHEWKTTNPKDALAEGWAVPSWGDPARWPARRWFWTDVGTLRLGWCLYDNAGNVTEISENEATNRMTEAGW